MPTRTRPPGFRLGRIAGLDIRADASWLFALFLVITSLASGFARWQSSWGPGVSLMVALVGSVLFFLSVLLHELAHAVVARAFGIGVSSITLFLFGGVSNIEREPDSPWHEFAIAIVGPLTSFALAAAFLCGAVVFSGPDLASLAVADPRVSLSPVTAVFLWLAPVNFALGVFNLIPGFPLDGGRVLRAFLWRTTGDLARSTRIAGAIGQGVGWGFIALGAAMVLGARVPWLGRGAFSGLWLAAIGWFLRNAAFATVRSQEFRWRLKGLLVRTLMRHPPTSVPPGVTVANLRDHWLYASGATVFPVVGDDRFLGWIDRKIVQSIPAATQALTTVERAMTPASSIPSVSPSDSCVDVLPLFARTGQSALPVLHDGMLIGWLLLEDLLLRVDEGNVTTRGWSTGLRDSSSV